MSDNKELNDNLERLFSTIKDAYGIERKPLFVSEDDKEIFEGDEYWYLNRDWEVHRCSYAQNGVGDDKVFSTEEKAKQHVYHNKICLSYNDAVKWLASDGSGYGLYEIVKEKINNQRHVIKIHTNEKRTF